MNLANRMMFDKIKQKWANGGKMDDTDIAQLMSIVNSLNVELKYFKDEQSLIIGKSRTGGKLYNSNLYGKMGDDK